MIPETAIIEPEYRYTVFNSDGVFLASWTEEVISPFKHIDQINTGGGGLSVTLGRSIRTKQTKLEPLLDMNDEPILDMNNQEISTIVESTATIGAGTDLYEGNYLYVDEYFGRIEPLLDMNEEPILDMNDEPILTVWGPVDGRRVFSGYISKLQPEIVAGREVVQIEALPFSTDLEESVYEVSLGINHGNLGGVPNNGARAMGASDDPTLRTEVAQKFRTGQSGELEGIMWQHQQIDEVQWPQLDFTVSLYTGADPNSTTKTLLASAKVTTLTEPLIGLAYQNIAYFDPGVTVAANTDYHFVISVAQYRTASNGPTYIYTTDTDDMTGQGYEKIGGTFSTLASAQELIYRVSLRTGVKTKHTYSNEDMGIAVQRAANFVSRNGGRVGTPLYGMGTRVVIRTGELVPQFMVNMNSPREMIDAATKAAPYGYYWRWDQADRYVYFQPRPDTPDHVFTLGKEIQSIVPGVSIENKINTVYFTGGETSPGVQLLRKYQDAAALAWDKTVKARRISDLRVTNTTSADTIANYELALYKDPLYEATVTVLDAVYDTGTIKVGHLIGFKGSGDYIDDLQMIVVRKERVKGKATLFLGSIPTTERRKVDDLRRAVAAIESQNLPDNPS